MDGELAEKREGDACKFEAPSRNGAAGASSPHGSAAAAKHDSNQAQQGEKGTAGPRTTEAEIPQPKKRRLAAEVGSWGRISVEEEGEGTGAESSDGDQGGEPSVSKTAEQAQQTRRRQRSRAREWVGTAGDGTGRRWVGVTLNPQKAGVPRRWSAHVRLPHSLGEGQGEKGGRGRARGCLLRMRVLAVSVTGL